ncbi:hypothetical protein G7009_18065 [Pseudomonas capeferrum]|uniref:hypothetical protein n=1 Tax=Pseudomonas TaxID=286 RepID=UPI0015E3DDB7|nr:MULTISPECIES: hypothetical protein [Pseudomonas]MBA1203630.1 hypothetical protein [Pseudomonas capeferrum]
MSLNVPHNRDAALGAIRQAIKAVAQAVDERELEGRARLADDLITDCCSAGRIDEDDLPDLKLELALTARKRLQHLRP